MARVTTDPAPRHFQDDNNDALNVAALPQSHVTRVTQLHDDLVNGVDLPHPVSERKALEILAHFGAGNPRRFEATVSQHSTAAVLFFEHERYLLDNHRSSGNVAKAMPQPRIAQEDRDEGSSGINKYGSRNEPTD